MYPTDAKLKQVFLDKRELSLKRWLPDRLALDARPIEVATTDQSFLAFAEFQSSKRSSTSKKTRNMFFPVLM